MLYRLPVASVGRGQPEPVDDKEQLRLATAYALTPPVPINLAGKLPGEDVKQAPASPPAAAESEPLFSLPPLPPRTDLRPRFDRLPVPPRSPAPAARDSDSIASLVKDRTASTGADEKMASQLADLLATVAALKAQLADSKQRAPPTPRNRVPVETKYSAALWFPDEIRVSLSRTNSVIDDTDGSGDDPTTPGAGNTFAVEPPPKRRKTELR